MSPVCYRIYLQALMPVLFFSALTLLRWQQELGHILFLRCFNMLAKMFRKVIPDLYGSPWKIFTGRDAAQVHPYDLHQDRFHAFDECFVCRMGLHAKSSQCQACI